LHAVVADDSAKVDGVRVRRRDPLAQCLVAGRLRVPRVEAEDLDAFLLCLDSKGIRDAFSKRLVVMDDVDGLDRHELLALRKSKRLAPKQLRSRRSLVIVASREARVVPLAGRVVDVRLALVVPGGEVREAD